MKICITSAGDNLTSHVEPRFEEASYFMIVDPETLECDSIENPDVSLIGGISEELAQMMIDNEVDVVLTGDIDPESYRILHKAGIKMVMTLSSHMIVNDVIEMFKEGKLEPTDTPDITDIGETILATDIIDEDKTHAESFRRGEAYEEIDESDYGDACVCPNCGMRVEHQPDVPCSITVCPECGTEMVS